MNRAIVVKFAVSAALLGTVAVGCKPSSHVASPSAVAPRADKQAAKLAGRAAAALAKKKTVEAVKFAEDAVALAPRDGAHRLLLGRAYIASGRFVSAEAALTDALALSPDDGQVQMSLALTRIALGKWDIARELLATARGKVGESDRGLALALAGDKEGGVAALEQAARAEGADAKARQNYALGLALAGRWAEARSIAAQDLAPAQVKARMAEWAQLSQPKDAWDQVSALLHVTPVEDTGMPAALALAPGGTPGTALAAAPVETPMETASLDAAPAAPAAGGAPQQLAEATPAGPAPSEIAQIDLPATSSPAPQMVELAAATPPPLIAAPAQPARRLVAPASTIRQNARGRYVVQLGAFSTLTKAETAWRATARRMDRVARLAPSSATFNRQGGSMVYRLSLAGFATRGEATNLCRQIRAVKGECFVRATAGDALANWSIKSPIRLASR